MCRKECIPEEGEFALQIPARRAPRRSTAAAFEAAFEAQPRPALDGAGHPARQRGPDRRQPAALERAGPAGGACAARRWMSSRKPPEVIETAATCRKQAWNGARMDRAASRCRAQRSEQSVRDAGGVGARAASAGAPSSRCWATGRRGRAGHACRRALDSRAQGQRRAQPPRPPAAAAPLAGCWRPAGCAAGRPDPEPDALRVPGAGHQGGGLRPPRRRPARATASAAWPTPPAWCCPSSRWARCCWPCAPPANSWAGASSCSRPAVVAALAALFTLIGLNLAGLFEFGSRAAQPAWPACRRATRWSTPS